LNETLVRRRALLRDLVVQVGNPLLVYSDGVVGCGREFFAQVVAQGHEGVMAKHVEGRYSPGKRSSTWRKFKPAGIFPCVIVGYTMGRAGLKSLLVAALRAGVLRYVGQLDRGLGAAARAELRQRLAARRRRQPVVPCPLTACWVEPELHCRVDPFAATAGMRSWLPPLANPRGGPSVQTTARLLCR
jgi:ATP-dependent DNA ligase